MSFFHRDMLDEVKVSGRPVTLSGAGKTDMASIIAVPFLQSVGNITQPDPRSGCLSGGLTEPMSGATSKYNTTRIICGTFFCVYVCTYHVIFNRNCSPEEDRGWMADVLFLH
jgi:hypothetical protein